MDSLCYLGSVFGGKPIEIRDQGEVPDREGMTIFYGAECTPEQTRSF